MRKAFSFLLPVLLFVSCSEDGMTPHEPVVPEAHEEAVPHEMIELGKKLDNPYTVKNISAAISAAYPTRSSVEVPATDLYVRFLPKGKDDFNLLDSLGVILFDYPLDYEIKTDGDYYHDPSIPENEASWQYAVVPASFAFPEGIDHELLDKCFIPDDEATTRGFEDVDWGLVEEMAYRQTGNETMLEPETRSRKVHPEGFIKIVDNGLYHKKTFGVAGVKVIVRNFVKFGKGYTDVSGHYEINRKFRAKLHYCLRFKNNAGFRIGFNKILVTASTSTFGTGSASGKDLTIDENSGDKLYRRCVVNNAAYDYITKCASYGISTPPKNLRIWILDFMKTSSALMLHHGTMLDNSLVKKYLNYYATIARVFMPDITIGTKGIDYKYSEIYAETVHELAHASHFARVGMSYWSTMAEKMLLNYITTGDEYGTGNGELDGMCGVSEMWAYFMEYSIYKQRYYREIPDKRDFWFHPEALLDLEQNGISKKDLYFALASDVKDIKTFYEYLEQSCPGKKSIIDRVYKQYFK